TSMEMEGANQQLLQAEQQAVADSQQPPSLLLQQQQPLVLGGLGSRRKRWPETSRAPSAGGVSPLSTSGGCGGAATSSEKCFKAGQESRMVSAAGYPAKLLSQLNLLRLCSDYCDLTLSAGGVQFPVHKNVLVASSDYFRAAFSSGMREAGASCLELKGVTAEGLQAVLEFVYTGSLALSVDRAEDILNTASHLQISEAVQLCIRFLQLALSLDNCVELLNLSELYCLDEFGSNVRTFLLENFEDLCRCGALQRLTAAQLSDLLGDNRLRVAGEYLVFFAVVQWLEHEPDSRLPAVGDLIDQVRLPLLSGEHLVEKVSCIGFMRDVPACSDRLTEAKDYHLVVNKQPVMQTPRTRVRNHQRSVVMCHAENLEAFNLATKRHAFLKDCAVPLYNPCICELANFLYACGGRYDGNEASEMASARCFRYDPRFDAWHELVPMNEARKDFALVATGNSCLMAIGGQDENMVMCTVERLCIATGEWRFLPSLQHAVYCHAAAVCDSRVFVSGGQRYDGYCDSLICYEPDSELWASRAAMLNKRGNHIMECVGSRLFVLGGNVEDIYGFPVPVTPIESYNSIADQWTLLRCSITIREAGSCVLDSRIYIAGGLDGENYYSHSLQVYDTQKDEVQLVERFPTRIYGRVCCLMTLPQGL
ncbi:hypothetical protein BOX15_Mlig033334g1, partial [Macrostomum lignano]